MSDDMRTPLHPRDRTIHQLYEGGPILPTAVPLSARSTEPNAATVEHPTASWLYRKFKPGSAILSKIDAYRIGNLIDEQAARIKELQTELAQCEPIERPRTRLAGLGQSDQPPDVVAVPRVEDPDGDELR